MEGSVSAARIIYYICCPFPDLQQAAGESHEPVEPYAGHVLHHRLEHSCGHTECVAYIHLKRGTHV